MSYIDDLVKDAATGLAAAGENFRTQNAEWLALRQNPDGGFCDRAGRSDPYYTGFALDALAMLGDVRPAVFSAAYRFATEKIRTARTVVELFSCIRILNAARRAGVADFSGATYVAGLASLLDADPDDEYGLYLGLLGCEMAGADVRTVIPPGRTERLSGAMLGKISGGGAQLTRVCAAATVVGIVGAHERIVRPVTDFILASRADEGFGPGPGDARPDLLSTFCAVTTLALYGTLDGNEAGAHRFAAAMKNPGGGFSGSRADRTPDCEYAYYALGVIGTIAGRRKP